MPVFDVSVPIQTGMITYPNDPTVRLEQIASLAGGDIANISQLACGVHTGTHNDAPRHFFDTAPGVDALPLDVLIGPAQVVDATELDGHIDAAALEQLAIPAECTRLLFKTRNSAIWNGDQFCDVLTAITNDAAQALVARGVRLVGVDHLSCAPVADPVPTHRTLLGAGVVIVEGLDLRRVPAGAYQLLCLPIKLVDADGAPARVVLQDV